MTQRVSSLCRTLTCDPELRTALPDAPWQDLADAVRCGDGEQTLTPLLDSVEASAAAAGIDGVTTADRRFEELPASTPGIRAVEGWRCPHPRPCDRATVAQGVRFCALTGDPLTPVTVISG